VTSNFATSTIADLALALEELASTELPGDTDATRPPEGVAPWVRAFSVELVDEPRGQRAVEAAEGQWTVFAPPEHPLGEALGAARRRGGRRRPALPARGQRGGVHRPDGRRRQGRPGSSGAVPLRGPRRRAGRGRPGQDPPPGIPGRAGDRDRAPAGRRRPAGR